MEEFLDSHPELIGSITIKGIGEPFLTSRAQIGEIAANYLPAVQQAGLIYDHISSQKGTGNFATEVSMDETDSPQTPPELLVILAAIADRKIPLQTIASVVMDLDDGRMLLADGPPCCTEYHEHVLGGNGGLS